MDSVDQETVLQVAKFLGGGWASMFISVLVGALLVWFGRYVKKARIEQANKVTAQESSAAKAAAPEQNHALQDEHNKSEDKLKAFEGRMKKEFPHDKG